MIVRDGSTTLDACLKSVAAVSDELIVVDTGSTDDSPEIARSFGGRVIRVPWPDDFSAARNRYLEIARCSWILSLDADEVLGPVDRDWFRASLKHQRDAAFFFTIRNHLSRGIVDYGGFAGDCAGEAQSFVSGVTTRAVRLFPRRKEIRYCFPLHESLRPALDRMNIRLKSCDTPIHHLVNLDRHEEIRTKARMYRRLGEKKIRQFPRYFLGYLELGKVLLYEGELRDAERMFIKSIRLNPLHAKSYHYLGLTLSRQGRQSEYRRWLLRTMRGFPIHADLVSVLRMLDLEERRCD